MLSFLALFLFLFLVFFNTTRFNRKLSSLVTFTLSYKAYGLLSHQPGCFRRRDVYGQT